MFIRRLELYNFRNYARLEIDLSARVHLFVGDNAQGKTNLLEAIYYLATTRSPLAGQDRELIRWQADTEDVIPNAQLALQYRRDGEDHALEASLVKEPSEQGAPGEDVYRRQLRHDGVNRRAMDVVGKLNVVLFLPEDIQLVSGSPGERRRYLDVFLCQLDAEYCRTLAAYNRVLTQRNALLRRIREGGARPGELPYWDTQLAHLGAYVMARRMWAVARLDAHTLETQRALTGGAEELRLRYEHTLARRADLDEIADCLSDADRTWREVSAPATGAVKSLERAIDSGLQSCQREELARAITVLGPHRDDMRFILDGYDARVYGSRGQQRTVALALKLSEVTLMHESVGEMPVLLLDDVLSELDRQRGRYVLERLAGAEQVLVTTTALGEVPAAFSARARVWRIQAGTAKPWTGPLQNNTPAEEAVSPEE
jgi:DNA replication and repair protein RecF